ncbi:hypothetical protein FRB90_003702 [Tulasnella sp. 427]|nr:hypothetical protein FRB90_003702 [Tulasnella sp. 427]
MVALSHSFAILLVSYLVSAKLSHPHAAGHHERHHALASKRSALARRAVSKRAICQKRISGAHSSTSSPSSVTSGASSDSNGDNGSSNNTTDDDKSSSSSPGVKGHSNPSGGKWWSATSGANDKTIIAHFIVGNAYSYTPSQWASEIKMAAAQGIDAFALNLGYDSWQAGQVQSAYDVAAANGFKMLLSFDMTVLGCGDGNIVRSNVNKYTDHPAQLKDNGGKAIVTTFDGGNCKSSGEWQSELGGSRFVPAFFNDLNSASLKSLYPVAGGDLLWGGAWPKFDEPISWSEDSFRISRNGLNRGAGDLYITTVAPWFFTHYGSKNFIWHNDDHLWNNRWEDLVQHRGQVDAVEIVSWNDYGESTYIGPVGKDQPGSEAWVNGFDHRAFLEMTGYYASAFKSGEWPSITSDKIFIYGRPHGVNDQASGDSLSRPERFNWVSDRLWVVLFSTGSGSLTVTQGSSSSTTQVKAGVNKISIPLGVASSVTAILRRGGDQVFEFTAPISFGHSPKAYNFNVNAAVGP